MTGDAIFILKQNGQLLEMNEAEYDSEDLLQSLLEKYPNLLAGKQIDTDSPRRWLLISRETPVPSDESGSGRWSLDHLFLDQDGIPTLVEVKRSSDTRIRREVVGQLLDYAANAVLYWPVEDIRNRFENRCEREEKESDLILGDFLRGAIEPEQFWDAVKTNLQAEKIRLVFVADEIPAELQRIVEFLNGQMDPAEVIAIQIKQFKGENLTTLVPRVVGQTAEAKSKKKRAGKRQWNRSSFFGDLAERTCQDDCSVAQRILDWANSSGLEERWGQGKTIGTFYPVLRCQTGDYNLFSVDTSGKITVVFNSFPSEIQNAKLQLLSKLNSIPGIAFPEKAIDTWGSFPMSVLISEDHLQEFLGVFEGFAETIRQIETLGNDAQQMDPADG